MTVMTHQDVFDCLESWAPKQLAYDWDPVGLQTGSFVDKTKGILISLDVTESVVDEAISIGANLIIAHHPLLFTPLKALDTTSQKGKVIEKLIKHDITVYAAHTNLDIAQGGVNDVLAKKINLQHTLPLSETASEALLKLVVYVPETHTATVRDQLGNTGAGHIGAYSHCAFQTPGTGSFLPQADANPYIGEKNELTYVKEDRLETIVKEKDRRAILDKLSEVHPYEEIAYDLYPVKQTGQAYGLGRIGTLEESVSLANLCDIVKQTYGVNHVRFVGQADQQIQKVAIIGGSGEKYINTAINAGADVLITGDVTFHPAQDAMEMNFPIIDAGHYIEKVIKEAVKKYLETDFPKLYITTSTVNTDPFRFM